MWVHQDRGGGFITYANNDELYTYMYDFLKNENEDDGLVVFVTNQTTAANPDVVPAGPPLVLRPGELAWRDGPDDVARPTQEAVDAMTEALDTMERQKRRVDTNPDVANLV